MIGGRKQSRYGSAGCCLLPTGMVTLALALLLGYYVIPYKIWEGVMQESKLIQGDNPRYNGWSKVPIPLFQNIYLFNVTNPDKVVKGKKPILQQLGPYVYEMKMEKFDIAFNQINGTVFYREKIDYFFRADLSNGSESDPISFPNVPYVATAQEAMMLGALPRFVLQQTMQQYPDTGLYLHTTVGQLLFGGIPLPFMKDLAEMKGEDILPNHTFGLMYGQNGSNQGLFEIYSGQKHPDNFGNIVSWNRDREWKWWEDDQFCRKINGSDGIFQPYATHQRIYYMFTPGLCRSFPYHFESEGSSIFGVPVYKYSVPPSFFQNPTSNPENTCYFSQIRKPYPENGVFPMRGCGKGPMMLSQPHFYQGSPTYLNQTLGLSPQKEKHEMTMYLEPYTATPMKVQVRFQMNIELLPNKYFKPLKKMPKIVHPLFWTEQTSGCPEEDANTIRNTLVFALKVINIVTLSIVFTSTFLIFLSIFLLIKSGKLCGKKTPCCVSSGNDDEIDCNCAKTKKKGSVLLRYLFPFHSLPNKTSKTKMSEPSLDVKQSTNYTRVENPGNASETERSQDMAPFCQNSLTS